MKLIRLCLVLLLTLVGAGLASPAHAEPTTWTAQLSGANELPANDSPGRGVAILSLSADGTELTYRLQVANIDNVIASHIHLGGAEVNGPVVAFLFGPAGPGTGTFNGTLATGTITAANLVGPLAGQPLSALVEQMATGDAYVNVHTNDGVPPTNTGPGDIASGEIRGQIG